MLANTRLRPMWWEKSREPQGALAARQPWLHPAVVLYLEYLIRPDWKVLEHGSGGSTLWLADRAGQVVSVEHDPVWMQGVIAAAPTNVSVYPNGRAKEAEQQAPFDLMIIDGDTGGRAAWCDKAIKLVRPGGIVVLDNYNRSEYIEAEARLSAAAAHRITFETSPIGHLYANTAFYRMPGGRLQDGETWI